MNKKLFVVFVGLLAVLAYAQTVIESPIQIRAEKRVAIFVSDANGQLVQADFSAPVSIDFTATPPRIVVAQTQQAMSQVTLSPGTAARSFTVPPGKQLVSVYLNGLLQRQTDDYTVTGNTVTFQPYYGSLQNVSVQALVN